MKIYKIFIGTPAYKWPVDPHFLASVNAIVNDPRFYVEYRAVVGDAHIERARAMVLLHYLKADETHNFDFFLNIDWDIEFRPDDVYRMCEKADRLGLNVVGGPYAFKTKDEGKNEAIVFRSKRGCDPTEDFMLEALYLGGGFTMVRSETLKKAVALYDKELGFNANPDLDKDFTRTCALWNPIIIPRPDWGEGKAELLSEDYSFCQRFLDMGESCWVDLQVILKHWDGEKCFCLGTAEVPNASI